MSVPSSRNGKPVISQIVCDHERALERSEMLKPHGGAAPGDAYTEETRLEMAEWFKGNDPAVRILALERCESRWT